MGSVTSYARLLEDAILNFIVMSEKYHCEHGIKKIYNILHISYTNYKICVGLADCFA